MIKLLSNQVHIINLTLRIVIVGKGLNSGRLCRILSLEPDLPVNKTDEIYQRSKKTKEISKKNRQFEIGSTHSNSIKQMDKQIIISKLIETKIIDLIPPPNKS